jgi:hypothetical protein
METRPSVLTNAMPAHKSLPMGPSIWMDWPLARQLHAILVFTSVERVLVSGWQVLIWCHVHSSYSLSVSRILPFSSIGYKSQRACIFRSDYMDLPSGSRFSFARKSGMSSPNSLPRSFLAASSVDLTTLVSTVITPSTFASPTLASRIC